MPFGYPRSTVKALAIGLKGNGPVMVCPIEFDGSPLAGFECLGVGVAVAVVSAGTNNANLGRYGV
jgi:hypothetical protein